MAQTLGRSGETAGEARERVYRGRLATYADGGKPLLRGSTAEKMRSDPQGHEQDYGGEAPRIKPDSLLGRGAAWLARVFTEQQGPVPRGLKDAMEERSRNGVLNPEESRDINYLRPVK